MLSCLRASDFDISLILKKLFPFGALETSDFLLWRGLSGRFLAVFGFLFPFSLLFFPNQKLKREQNLQILLKTPTEPFLAQKKKKKPGLEGEQIFKNSRNTPNRVPDPGWKTSRPGHDSLLAATRKFPVK